MWKQIVGYLPAWGFYWLGDGISRIINAIPDNAKYSGKIFYVLFPLYSKCMLLSCDINDWAGLKIWTDSNGN